MVDEHRAGASFRAGYGGAEAKLGEQTAGPVGWGTGERGVSWWY